VGSRSASTVPAQVSPPQFALSPLSPAHVVGVEVLAYAVQPGDAAGDALVVGVEADELAASAGFDLVDYLQRAGLTGEAGQTTSFPAVREGELVQVVMVGVGDLSPLSLRRAGAAVARATFDRASLATDVPTLAADGLEPFVVGAMLGGFSFQWRREGPEHHPVERIALCGYPEGDDRFPDLQRAVAVGGASWRARTLASVPANVKNPAWMAQQAKQIAGEVGLDVTVWDEKRLAKEGFGGLLGVGQASATPPRLIRLDYAPARASRRTPTVVLVGKGITFDSGGLSIKPGEGMVTMKRDMTGGGVVLSVMAALAAVRCPVRVVGLVAAAENAVSGNAMRPGDVLEHYGGRTSEVTNTDAEGRLVLADAMAYAVKEIKPAAIVDVATLTGAMKVALGQGIGGYFANHDALADLLEVSGSEAGEPLWRFPLVADYEDKLTSQVADADNAPGGPGAITAALFLQHFAGDVPWAHLDIASVGDSPQDRDEWTAGPTGFGARVLLRWLGSDQPLAGVR